MALQKRLEVDACAQQDVNLKAGSPSFASFLANSMKAGGKTKEVSQWFKIKWSRKTSLEGFETPVEPPPKTRTNLPEPKEELETPVVAKFDEAWVELRDEDGFAYFWDRRSNSCTWELPSGVCPKWIGQKSESGRTYYWASGEQKTYWSLPVLLDLPFKAGAFTGREEETPTIANQQLMPELQDCGPAEDLILETPVLKAITTSAVTEPGCHAEIDLLRIFGYSETELQQAMGHNHRSLEHQATSSEVASTSLVKDCHAMVKQSPVFCETPVLLPTPENVAPSAAHIPDTELPTPPLAACVLDHVLKVKDSKSLTDEDHKMASDSGQELSACQQACHTSIRCAADGCVVPGEAPTDSTPTLRSAVLPMLVAPMHDTPKAEARSTSKPPHPEISEKGNPDDMTCGTHVVTPISTIGLPMPVHPKTSQPSKEAMADNAEDALASRQPDIASSMAPVITIVPAVTPDDVRQKVFGSKLHGCKHKYTEEVQEAPAGKTAGASEVVIAKDSKIEELSGKLDATTQDSARLRVEVAILKKKLAAVARMRSAMEKGPQQSNDTNSQIQAAVSTPQPSPMPLASTASSDKQSKAIAPSACSVAGNASIVSLQGQSKQPGQSGPCQPEMNTTECKVAAKAVLHDDDLVRRIQALRQPPSKSGAKDEQEPHRKRQRIHHHSDISSGSSKRAERTPREQVGESQVQQKKVDPTKLIAFDSPNPKALHRGEEDNFKHVGEIASCQHDTCASETDMTPLPRRRALATCQPNPKVTTESHQGQHGSYPADVDMAPLPRRKPEAASLLKQNSSVEDKHSKDSQNSSTVFETQNLRTVFETKENRDPIGTDDHQHGQNKRGEDPLPRKQALAKDLLTTHSTAESPRTSDSQMQDARPVLKKKRLQEKKENRDPIINHAEQGPNSKVVLAKSMSNANSTANSNLASDCQSQDPRPGLHKKEKRRQDKKANRDPIDSNAQQASDSKVVQETAAIASQNVSKTAIVESHQESSILDKFMTEILYGKPLGNWETTKESDVKECREGSLTRKRSRRASRGGA